MSHKFRTHANGNPCCSNPDPKLRCAACQAHVRSATSADDGYVPPDPYLDGLAKMRAASATPSSTFEFQWKRQRASDLAEEFAESHAKLPGAAGSRMRTEPRMLSAGELTAYAPPDGYAEALRSAEGRR